jgi:hypothetical protein
VTERITTLLRFSEEAGVPPQDTAGGLDDLVVVAGASYPTKTLGPIGSAAVFVPATPIAIQAKDLISGGTLFTRDVTVQAWIAWDFDTQNTYGSNGTIIARGKGNAAADYMPYAVELRVVNVAARIGEIRWIWQDSAGTLKTQIGGQFVAPAAGQFLLLTATRHWNSPTDVTIRYYVNDQRIIEATSVDGDIGGGTTGTTTIGTRYSGGAYGRYLAAQIDELAIAEYEMCLEEIEAGYLRVAVYQPDGYRQIKDLYQPGMPISADPASRVQTDLRTMGVGLGFADGLIENMRNNIMPDRAYGKVLQRWERTTEQPPRPNDSIDRRRARVIGQLRKRGGVSPPAVETALADLLATQASQLEVIAFDNTIREAWSSIDLRRWAATAGWDVTGNEGRVQAAAGTYTWDQNHQNGLSIVTGIESPRDVNPHTFNGVSIFGSVDLQTLAANGEAGFVFWDWALGSMLFFGIRNVAGSYKVGYQRFTNGVATDASFVVLATTALVKHWLRIRPPDESTMGALSSTTQNYQLSYSTASGAEADLITAPDLLWRRQFTWAGMYFRTNGATAGASDVRYGNDWALRNAKGTNPFYFYVYRDPALPGVPDILGAEAVIARMRHAFTKACVITTKSVLCDIPSSTYDCGFIGP